MVTHEAQKIFENQPIQYCDTLAKTVQDVDVVLLITRWAEFEALPDLLQEMANPPLMIDGRRILTRNCLPAKRELA